MESGARATELQPGQEFAGHRIDRVAGRGGMGVVYEATDLRLKRTVALKVIAPALAAEPNFQQRFERECELAASIDHPAVIPVFAAGEENGAPYVTMRYVQGTDLAQMIARDGRLPPSLVATVGAKVGEALDSAHARGLVHRDVKPANVLVRGGPGEEEVFLTDFGLTREVSSDTRFTATGHVIGTVDYMSPEQFEDSTVDALSDVYALACVLYEALTGVVPFPAEGSAAKLFAHTTADRPSVLERAPDLSPVLDRVVQKGMAKSRDERFQSAGELGRAAKAAIDGDVAEATAALGVVGVATGPIAGPEETTESVREEETAESVREGESATVALPPEAPPPGPPRRPAQPTPPQRVPPPPPGRARRRIGPLAIALGVASLLIVAAIAYAVLGNSEDSGSGGGSASDSSAPRADGGGSGEELDEADLALAAEVPAGAAADVTDYSRGVIEDEGYERRVDLVQLRDPGVSDEDARSQALDELIFNRWVRAQADADGFEFDPDELINEGADPEFGEEVSRLEEVGYEPGGIVLDTEARLDAERLFGEDSAPVDALMSGYDPALADEIGSLIDTWRPGTACTEELAPLSPLCGNGPDP